ncbi:hypothetical protein BDP27DRAFT_1372773 [Rhodocollybia butyracea]|uniref:Uncharacterized protein n=1 Tax=Rhodocollybia butyracea TaxID=206335 RepID=A0A9P5P7L7_9AGAR|nr:hypothetical protein BDP27DRAFT_1372773 [Rhodocollybia butyracea]
MIAQESVNSLGQSPCQVAGYLAAVCVGGGVGARGGYYGTLDGQHGLQIVPQHTMLGALKSSFCLEKIYRIYSYPNPIPSETAIPQWAFQTYSQDPDATLNITLAEAEADLPESFGPQAVSPTGTAPPLKAPPSPTSTASPSSTSMAPPRSASAASPSSTTSAVPSSSSSTALSSSASNAPPKPTGSESGTGKPNNAMTSSSNLSKKALRLIVGGVIGALTLLFLLGLGLWWLRKRKRRREQNQAKTKSESVYTTIPSVLLSVEDSTMLEVTSTERRELQQRTELVQSIHGPQQSQFTRQSTTDESIDLDTGSARDPLQSRIQEIEARMENFMTEMGRYIQPPAYEK